MEQATAIIVIIIFILRVKPLTCARAIKFKYITRHLLSYSNIPI